MHRYYKISKEWADRLGESRTAVEHPDGMFLVLPGLGHRISDYLHRENGGARLLPEEAFNAIGAFGLSVAEAHASMRGELRHDTNDISDKDEIADNDENDENS